MGIPNPLCGFAFRAPHLPRYGWQMRVHDGVPNEHKESVRSKSQKGKIFSDMS